jgi:hypothetical protein
MTAAAVVVIAIGVAGVFVFKGAKDIAPTSPESTQSADVVMEELLAAINADSKLKVFGKSKLEGRTATIYLESGYAQLPPSRQRELLETVHNVWVNGAFGKRSVYKSWDGKVVADLGG